MGSNNFLVFDENQANMVDDVTYAALDYRANGARQGVAPSNVHNKLFYQTSIMAAALGQLLANRGYTVSDADFDALVAVLGNLADGPSVLALAGGTMTGDLILDHDPVELLEAATKQYVDGSGLPPGGIVYFARATAPAGFIVANGALLSRATYAKLWAEAQISGNLLNEAQWAANNWGAYSTGDGATTFRIPDLRGEFIRGLDLSRGVDSGRTIGSWQTDLLKSHVHTINVRISGQYFQVGSSSFTAVEGPTPGLSTDSFGGTETRPRNVALLPCIRY